MAIDNNSLCYLFDSIFQVENVAGRPVVGGHIEVFIAGTDQKYITWQNFDGTKNPFKIPLNNDGRAVILVEPHYTYDIYIYDSFNNMICSRLNVKPAIGGDVTVYGLTEVWHDDTMSGEGTPQSPLSVVSAGKVYNGIDPIIVNNELNRISANHIPLGVQDPLYFVEDSETACIIGFSGTVPVPEGTMNESAFGYEEGQITSYNGSAFSAGNSYEAGSYVSIDDNTISVTGLSPIPADTASTGLVASVSADITAMIPDTSDMATQTWVNEQGFLTAHQDLSDYQTTAGMTAYQPVGDYQTAGNYLSASDSANFYPMTGNPSGFLTAHQSLQGYATEQWVEDKGYITGVDIPESANWNSTTETVSSNSAAWCSATPQIPVTGINGIKISESGDKVVFEISADYATQDWVTSQGYLTAETDWSDTITAASANAYSEATAAIPTGLATTGDLQTVSAEITAMIPTALTGEYLDKASADTLYYPLTGNPSGFITGVDLTPYQLTADMTAYQPTGDYVTADVLSSYKLENSALTVSSVTPVQELGIDTGVAEYGIDGVRLASGHEDQYSTDTYNVLSLRPGGLSGYSGQSANYFNVNASGIDGSPGYTGNRFHLDPVCVSGSSGSTAWSYGDKFTNVGFVVKQYGNGLFISYPEYSGSENSVAINSYGLTASGGSGNSAKTIVGAYDVQVTSYNGDKTYSLTAISESQPTTGNMAGYKYIDFPWKAAIFGHTANVQEARKELDYFDTDATFNNASEGIISGMPWDSYVNIPFTASADKYDIKWNITGGYGYDGFTAAILTATAEALYTANSIASAAFTGKSGVFDVTGLTENTTYYLYAYGRALRYDFTTITPFTAEIGSAIWYNYTATSAGFVIPDEPVLTFKVIGE